jgi:hypothetical protein
MWNISKNSYDVSMSQALKASSQFEKPYLASWIKETNPIERENILEMVPEEVGNLLRAKWGMTFDVASPSKYQQMIPNADWEGMIPNDNLEDIKYKTINQEGMRAHDFGMGWFDQQRRVANTQFELNPVTDISQVSMANTVASRIKSALMRQLGSMVRRPLIAVSMTPGNSDSVKIQLNLMRDRFEEIREVFRKG